MYRSPSVFISLHYMHCSFCCFALVPSQRSQQREHQPCWALPVSCPSLAAEHLLTQQQEFIRTGALQWLLVAFTDLSAKSSQKHVTFQALCCCLTSPACMFINFKDLLKGLGPAGCLFSTICYSQSMAFDHDIFQVFPHLAAFLSH